MRVLETILQSLCSYLYDKKVLEIACGESDFSLTASKYAREVLATDISLERFKRRSLKAVPKNIDFKEMDATNLNIDDDSFDVCICYNALGHLQNILMSVLAEMIRVTAEEGYLIFIATWKIDKNVIPDLKNIIKRQNSLAVYGNIENEKYSVLIIKKKINV